MSLITEISPLVLRVRHRLSSQQINMLFGVRVIDEGIEEKGEALEQVAGFMRLTDSLTVAGVPFIPLKGPLLSERLYGDPTVRHSHDLDILVNEAVIDKAARVLLDTGYRHLSPALPDDVIRRGKLIKYNHHLSFTHQGNGQIVELHWRIMNRPWVNFADIDGLLMENLTVNEFAGRRFTVPVIEFELLYLIIHGGAHHCGRLKWLADVHRMLETRMFSEVKFKDLTERLKAGRLVALCNMVLKEYMPPARQLPCNAEAPAYMVRSVREALAGDAYHGPQTIKEIVSNIRYALSAYRGLAYKLKLVCTVVSNSLLSGRLSRALD